MSNLERQRRFCERNPGYYRKRKARNSARMQMVMAEMATPAAAQMLALPAPVEVCVIPAKPAPLPLLMLPAPVEVIVIPGLNAIPSRAAAVRERVAV